jgi:sulfate adenylyltransferase
VYLIRNTALIETATTSTRLTNRQVNAGQANKIEVNMVKALIQPHGGQLIDCLIPEANRQATFIAAQSLPKLTLSERNIADLECIATGVYSPLEGFVTEQDYHTIVNHMRLSNGLAWSIPVTLQIAFDEAAHYPLDQDIALVHPSGTILAIMTVTSKYIPDQLHEAQQVYRTDDAAHPGVQAMKQEGNVYLGGPVRLVQSIAYPEFNSFRLTPAMTRQHFQQQQWHTIAAFQTRNPIHRAHEYITKVALEVVDGLFINPLVGATKSDDIPADVRMRCYEVLLEKYYPRQRVMLGVFPAAMRYAGPREAIMHAIARQNYGCTHFIVGRDHAGVGDYYGTYDAQYLFDEFTQDELKILPLKFEHAFYCTRTQTMATAKTSPGTPEERIHLSGTKVRQLLRDGQTPPPEFSRPEVAAILVASMQAQLTNAS